MTKLCSIACALTKPLQAGLGTCFCQASGTILRAGWDAYWFAFLQDEPPYMASIFGKRAVYRKSILRTSFADPSLIARSALLVGALLYLGVAFERANRKGRQHELTKNKSRLAFASLLSSFCSRLTSVRSFYGIMFHHLYPLDRR